MKDNLATIRDLPQTLLNKLGKIIVNRQGVSPSSTMLTLDIIGSLKADTSYKLFFKQKSAEVSLLFNEIKKSPMGHSPRTQERVPKTPPHVKIKGVWNKEENITNCNANILGGFGNFTSEYSSHSTEVPVLLATNENLAFYKAKLLSHGESFHCNAIESMPVTRVQIGANYVKDYLRKETFGGGDYIEYHNTPHLWTPINEKSKGHILLGKFVDNVLYLTGFKIPYQKAIYLSPNVIHSDAYLIGDYWVVYTVSSHYSSVLFTDPNRRPIHLLFKDLSHNGQAIY